MIDFPTFRYFVMYPIIMYLHSLSRQTFGEFLLLFLGAAISSQPPATIFTILHPDGSSQSASLKQDLVCFSFDVSSTTGVNNQNVANLTRPKANTTLLYTIIYIISYMYGKNDADHSGRKYKLHTDQKLYQYIIWLQ